MEIATTPRVAAVALVLLMFLPAPPATAGTTGKIMGRVTDAEGRPLPGASVMIEGTQRGMEADSEGVYFLLAVPPGHHSLVASMIGYSTQRKSGVVVSADFTSNAFFGLAESPVELDRMVVEAHRWQRPPVDLDRTSTVHVVSAEEIEQTPIIRTTGELVSLQPGVDQAGTYAVRGSGSSWGNTPRTWGTHWNYPNDVFLIIDGVRVPNQDGHSAILFAGVNKSVVQQVSIETGVLPAEYGDAQAGAVNLVTREGGRDLHGWTELHYEPAGRKHWGSNVYEDPMHRDHMRWDDPEWVSEADPLTGRVIHQRTDYKSWSGFTVEGSLFGPVGPKASFAASMSHQHRAAVYPSAESHGFYNDRGAYINAPNNWQGSATLTSKPTGGTKLKTGLILQRYTAWNNEMNEYNYAKHGFIRRLRFGGNEAGRNLFLPEKWASSGRYLHQEDLEYVSFSHALSSRTFYERAACAQPHASGHHRGAFVVGRIPEAGQRRVVRDRQAGGDVGRVGPEALQLQGGPVQPDQQSESDQDRPRDRRLRCPLHLLGGEFEGQQLVHLLWRRRHALGDGQPGASPSRSLLCPGQDGI
ncbi:MAG: TonB-dependent receptor [Candidatus Latescibacteria bacterium]|nr:TonB-dependent receptor [Candidatus Latescibacterota bacterium]